MQRTPRIGILEASIDRSRLTPAVPAFGACRIDDPLPELSITGAEGEALVLDDYGAAPGAAVAEIAAAVAPARRSWPVDRRRVQGEGCAGTASGMVLSRLSGERLATPRFSLTLLERGAIKGEPERSAASSGCTPRATATGPGRCSGGSSLVRGAQPW